MHDRTDPVLPQSLLRGFPPSSTVREPRGHGMTPAMTPHRSTAYLGHTELARSIARVKPRAAGGCAPYREASTIERMP